MRQKRGFKLPKLVEAVDILLKRSHEGAHRAMIDCRATADLYWYLIGLPTPIEPLGTHLQPTGGGYARQSIHPSTMRVPGPDDAKRLLRDALEIESTPPDDDLDFI